MRINTETMVFNGYHTNSSTIKKLGLRELGMGGSHNWIEIDGCGESVMFEKSEVGARRSIRLRTVIRDFDHEKFDDLTAEYREDSIESDKLNLFIDEYGDLTHKPTTHELVIYREK